MSQPGPGFDISSVFLQKHASQCLRALRNTILHLQATTLSAGHGMTVGLWWSKRTKQAWMGMPQFFKLNTAYFRAGTEPLSGTKINTSCCSKPSKQEQEQSTVSALLF